MELSREELQYKKMTETPVKRLVLSLGIPTSITMVVTTLYNIADTAFVSHLSTSASGAVSVIFPLMAIIQAVGFTFGMGAGSNISAKLGEKKDQEAQVMASSALFSSLLFGLLITIVGLLLINPLMYWLGATDSVFPYAKDYAMYILLGAPIMASSYVLNNILRAEGKAKLSMIGLVIGAVINVGLDPLLIFTFNMGIAGAAIATIISQAISFVILLSFFLSHHSLMTLNPKYISKQFVAYAEIIKVGLPSFFRQTLASIATILLNNQAAIYGSDAALSAMGIVSKIFMVIFAVALGIGQGYQPVAGYNYASKNYSRVKEAMLFTYITSTCLMTTICILMIIFSKYVFLIFLNDPEVIEIGVVALRFQCLALPFLALNVICNMTFQSIRKKNLAVLLSSCRQGIFFIPLVFVLPLFWGLTGVEITQACADFCTFLFSIPFAISFVKSLNKLIEEGPTIPIEIEKNKNK